MLKYDAAGLIPAVVQDAETNEVLMVAYMNAESLARTRETGDAWFWSRRRGELWHKGATSGNYLRVVEIRADCDYDVVLLRVRPTGPVCHTGAVSCFFNAVDDQAAAVPSPGETPPAPRDLQAELFEVIKQRQRERPEGSYVAGLFARGVDRIARKVGEEAAEVIIAAKNRDRQELAREMADLWFHSLILLADAGMTPDEVWQVLAERRRSR